MRTTTDRPVRLTPSGKRCEKALTRNDVVRLFGMMAVDYGHRWTSRFKDPKLTKLGLSSWFEKMQHLYVEEVDEGYQRCGREYPDWPPTVHQFVNLCRHPDLAYHHWLLPEQVWSPDFQSPGYLAFREAYARIVGHELDDDREPVELFKAKART